MKVEQLSTHSFSYRYFQIIKLPAKAMNPVTRYSVRRDDNSYGLFDSMDEAIEYIDKLCVMRKPYPYIDEVPFIANRNLAKLASFRK